LFRHFHSLATNGVGDLAPGPPHAGTREQAELSTARAFAKVIQQP
jgi:hypothetical protein